MKNMIFEKSSFLIFLTKFWNYIKIKFKFHEMKFVKLTIYQIIHKFASY